MAPRLHQPSPEDSVIEDALEDQFAVLTRLREGAAPQWLNLDLTIGQLKALFALFQAGPTPVGQLGAMLGLGKPAASLLVDALVRHQLVARQEDPTDRRRTLVRLLPEAQAMIAEQITGSREQFAAWLRQLSPADLESLARGLRALATVAAAPAARAAS